MSLWTSIRDFATKRVLPAVVGGLVGGPAGAAIGGLGRGGAGRIGTPPIMPQSFGPAAGAVISTATRTLPAIGRVAVRGAQAARRSPVGRLAGAAAAGAAGAALFDEFGCPVKKKTRRMNPCNEKALRRAVRRISAYDRQRKRVDRALRKACPPTARRTRRSTKPC